MTTFDDTFQVGEATGEERTAVEVPLGETGTLQAEPEQETRGGLREYVVLKKVAGSSPDSPETFQLLGSVVAGSTEQAARVAGDQFAADMNDGVVTYLVVVAERSFSHQMVEVEITRRVVVK